MNKILAFLIVGFVLITSSGVAQTTLKRSPNVASYESALDLIKKEKYAAAIQELEYLEKRATSPIRKIEIEFYLALCALNLDQPEAEELFLTFIKENPSHPKMNLAFYQMGSYYYRKQNFDKTITYLSKADLSFLDDEKRYAAEFDLGYSYFVRKKLPEAEEQFDKIKNKDHNYKYAANYYSGYIKFVNDKYDGAIADLKVAEENGVYAQIVPYMIVNIYYKKADYKALVRYSEPVLKGDSKVSKKEEILLLTAESYFMMQDYTKSGNYFDQYIAFVGKGNKEVTYRAGYSALKNGDTEKAISYFKAVADTKDSLGQYASYYLGQTYISKGNKAYALSALKEASKTDFNTSLQEEAMYDVARLHYELEQFDLAIQALSDFDKKFPQSSKTVSSQELLSDAYVYTNNYDAALSYLESKPALTTKMKANYQQVAYQKGIDLYNKKMYDKSIIYFDKSISTPIDNGVLAETHYWKGEAFSRLHKWEEAKNAYASVFRGSDERSLTFINARYGIGYTYFNLKDYNKAKEHFTKFIADNKKGSPQIVGDAMMRLADCYFFEKKYKEAITRYQGAIEKKVPGVDYAYYQLGLVYEASDNIEEAEKQLALLETTFPSSPLRVKASYNRARIAFEDGKYQKAEMLFTSYLGRYSKDQMVSFALLQRAKTYYNLGTMEKSLADYDRILSEYCKEPIAAEALSGSQQTLNRLNKGADFDARLSKFEQCNPNNKSIEKIRFDAAESSYRANDNKVAAESFNKFLADYPASSYQKQATYYLADAYFGLKDYDNGIVYYKKVVESGAREDYEKSLIKLSRMYLAKERYAEAKESGKALLKVASSRGKQGEAISTLIVSLYNLKSLDSCLAYADKVIADESAPNYLKLEAYMYAAKSNLALEELNVATDQFLYVVNASKDESGAEANYNVGLILYKKKQYKQSLELLYQMNKTYGTYDLWIGKSFLLIAENNLALGEEFQAKATLQSLVDYSTNKKIVEEAKARLKAIEEAKKKAEVKPKELIDAVDLHAPEEDAIQQVDSTNVKNK